MARGVTKRTFDPFRVARKRNPQRAKVRIGTHNPNMTHVKTQLKTPVRGARDIVRKSRLTPAQKTVAYKILAALNKNPTLAIEDLSLQISRASQKSKTKLNPQGTTAAGVVKLYRLLVKRRVIKVGKYTEVQS